MKQKKCWLMQYQYLNYNTVITSHHTAVLETNLFCSLIFCAIFFFSNFGSRPVNDFQQIVMSIIIYLYIYIYMYISIDYQIQITCLNIIIAVTLIYLTEMYIQSTGTCIYILLFEIVKISWSTNCMYMIRVYFLFTPLSDTVHEFWKQTDLCVLLFNTNKEGI